MVIPDHLICLLENFIQVKKQQLEPDMDPWTDSKLGKEYVKTAYCPPWLFNLHTEYITRNAGLDEAQAAIKIARSNINKIRDADDTTLMAESEEELKSLLMKVTQESEKVGWKVNIQKTKIMASSSITSWQIDGETMETVRDFIFLGSKISADGDSSHEIQRRLLLGRKAMTKRQRIKKQRHYFADQDPSSEN